MIVFDLRCGGGHVFEAWFGSSEAYAGQQSGGLVRCPICDDQQVEKALMAPAVSPKSNRSIGRADKARKAELARLAAVQAEVERTCDYVGQSFANEARVRHAAGQMAGHGAPGDSDDTPPVEQQRGIFGEASMSEAMDLIDEGIAIEPLPFRSRRSADA